MSGAQETATEENLEAAMVSTGPPKAWRMLPMHPCLKAKARLPVMVALGTAEVVAGRPAGAEWLRWLPG